MGYKPLSSSVKTEILRNTAKTVKSHQHSKIDNSLVMAFTKDDFDIYNHYYERWGRSHNSKKTLVSVLEKDQIVGPALDLALLRLRDSYTHQKIWQQLKYRWTDIYLYNVSKTNNNKDLVWEKIAKNVFNRMLATPRLRSPEWGVTKEEIIPALVKCFKRKFQEQNGLCVYSKVPLDIALGRNIINKCSIDRIDSSLPYNDSNIQLVALWVNTMKSDASETEFFNRVKLLAQAQKL